MLYSKSRSYHPSSPPHCRPEGGTQRSAADTQQSLPVFGQYKTAAFPLIKSTFSRHSAGCWDSAKPNLDPDDEWSPQSVRRIMDSKKLSSEQLKRASGSFKGWTPEQTQEKSGDPMARPFPAHPFSSSWFPSAPDISPHTSTVSWPCQAARPIMTHTHHLSSPHFHPFSMPHLSTAKLQLEQVIPVTCSTAWRLSPRMSAEMPAFFAHSTHRTTFESLSLTFCHRGTLLLFTCQPCTFASKRNNIRHPWSNDPRRLWRIWFVSDTLSDRVCCMLIIFSEVSAPSMLAARILGETFGRGSLRGALIIVSTLHQAWWHGDHGVNLRRVLYPRASKTQKRVASQYWKSWTRSVCLLG